MVSDKAGIDHHDRSEFELRLDNYSSINCISEQPSKSIYPNSQDQTKTKISYYVRDEFQPLESQQTNIEKLLIYFQD